MFLSNRPKRSFPLLPKDPIHFSSYGHTFIPSRYTFTRKSIRISIVRRDVDCVYVVELRVVAGWFAIYLLERFVLSGAFSPSATLRRRRHSSGGKNPRPGVSTGVYSLPQYQQAQQLFQRDAQIITPEALESVKAAIASGEIDHKAEPKKKAIPRKAAGQSWEDPTLAEWPENDFRLFCGDLGNEVNDDVLSKAFSRFSSFNMARMSM